MELKDLSLEQIDQLLIEAEDFGGSLPAGLQFKSGAVTFQIKDIIQDFVDEMFDEVNKRHDKIEHPNHAPESKGAVCPDCNQNMRHPMAAH